MKPNTPFCVHCHNKQPSGAAYGVASLRVCHQATRLKGEYHRDNLKVSALKLTHRDHMREAQLKLPTPFKPTYTQMPRGKAKKAYTLDA